MSESLWSVAEDGFGLLVAVGGNGVIVLSEDAGGTWVPQASGVTNNLYAVCYVPSFGGWLVVGQDGLILRSADAKTWVAVPSGVSTDLFGVVYAGVLLAVGAGGVLLLSADDGLTWDPKSSGTTEDLFNITADLGIYTIVGANDTIIVG